MSVHPRSGVVAAATLSSSSRLPLFRHVLTWPGSIFRVVSPRSPRHASPALRTPLVPLGVDADGARRAARDRSVRRSSASPELRIGCGLTSHGSRCRWSQPHSLHAKRFQQRAFSRSASLRITILHGRSACRRPRQSDSCTKDGLRASPPYGALRIVTTIVLARKTGPVERTPCG